MKPFLSAALTLAFSLTAHAGVVIVQDVEQTGPMPLKTRMTIKAEGEKARVDIGKEISSIVDSESGEVSSLMHAQKIAMQLPKGALDAMKEKVSDAGKNEGPDIKPTGKKEKINGFDCEEYAGTFQGLDVAYWVTNDLPNASAVMDQLGKLSGGANPFKGVLKNGEDFPGFPIRTVITTPQAGTSTMTIVSVNEEEIPAAEFEVPKNYKSMELPSMPGQGEGVPSLPGTP
jgi:hypothetical protein